MMPSSPTNHAPITPPTARQVDDYLERHPPRGPSSWKLWLPLIALGALIGMVFASDHVLIGLLPWVGLALVLLATTWRARHLRDLEQRAIHVQELTVMQHHGQSLRLAWRLLPQLSTLPQLHGRIVALMAHNLDQIKAYEPAIVTYNYLIGYLPPDHPGAVQLTIHRAIAQLAGDHLADADDALRRLRRVIHSFSGSVIAASYRLAALRQQVRTNHFTDAVQGADDLVEDLRPLGMEAAYGHALMALSFYKLGQSDDPLFARQAEQWWSWATLLLPPGALVDRFSELQQLIGASLPRSIAPQGILMD